jgi:hypothetical protein
MPSFDEQTPVQRRTNHTHDEVDDASLDSFPASDPPGWTSLRIGPPAPSQIDLATRHDAPAAV